MFQKMFKTLRMLYGNLHVLGKTFSTQQVFFLQKHNKNFGENPVSGEMR